MKIKRYSQMLRTDGAVVELAFDGSEETGKSNPSDTKVVLRCQTADDRGQWSTKWERQFGSPPMPSGPWHAPKLLAHANGRAFVAISSSLIEVDVATGESKWDVETGNTPIRDILVLQSGGIAVLNDYFDFNRDDASANLAAYLPGGKEIWRCKLDQDMFVSLNLRGGSLQANTWNGFLHVLNQGTGRTESRLFTK